MSLEDRELRLLDIASGQAGYFTGKQALSAGYSYQLQSYYALSGQWIRVHPGLYRLRLFPAQPREHLVVLTLLSRNREGEPQAFVSHDTALAIFDKMLGTDQTQTFKRKMLLMKLTHALDKHAHQEEMVVYPALREANEAVSADQLEGEHGYIKTFIYELNEMGPDSGTWLEKVREFRDLVSRHAHMEEEEVFPRFKQVMDEEQNAHITSLVNRDGFWMA